MRFGGLVGAAGRPPEGGARRAKALAEAAERLMFLHGATSMSTNLPRRRNCRLPGYDYSQPGAYFVTIVTHGRSPVLGRVREGVFQTSTVGEAVREEWFRTGELRDGVLLLEDEMIVMPNHVHGIIRIEEREGRSRAEGPSRSLALGTIVGNFKAASTRRAREILGDPGRRLWQRGFYDHVIRNEDELEEVRRYILENPFNWLSDPDNPAASDANVPDWMT